MVFQVAKGYGSDLILKNRDIFLFHGTRRIIIDIECFGRFALVLKCVTVSYEVISCSKSRFKASFSMLPSVPSRICNKSFTEVIPLSNLLDAEIQTFGRKSYLPFNLIVFCPFYAYLGCFFFFFFPYFDSRESSADREGYVQRGLNEEGNRTITHCELSRFPGRRLSFPIFFCG